MGNTSGTFDVAELEATTARDEHGQSSVQCVSASLHKEEVNQEEEELCAEQRTWNNPGDLKES
jgi:hypothetical protein